MRIRSYTLVAVILVTIGLVALRVTAASWVEPASPQPIGEISNPLNTSSQAQSKKGGLTIGGTLTVNPADLTLGASNQEKSRICWNGTDGAFCKTGWDSLTSLVGYLHLSPAVADVGSVYLTGPAVVGNFYPPSEDTVNPTIRGIASVPTGSSATYGVYGEASSSTGGPSAGVYAVSGSTNDDHRALFADSSGTPSAWAGLFNGSVAVSDPLGGRCRIQTATVCSNNGECPAPGDSCMPYPSLAIGSVGPAGSPMDKGYLCLGSAGCMSSWPATSGNGFWTGVNTLRPIDTTKSIAVAGAGAGAGATIDVRLSGGSPVSSKFTVRGTAKFDQYTVGRPPDDLDLSYTCGDGICRTPENDVYGSPSYCPLDCDHTPPGNAYPRLLDIQVCNRRSRQLCPLQPFKIYPVWDNPSDLDFAGSKVVIRTDRFPTGPDDNDFGDASGGILGSDLDRKIQPCALQKQMYYIGVYSFDQVGNISSGLTYDTQCTDALVLIVEY